MLWWYGVPASTLWPAVAAGAAMICSRTPNGHILNGGYSRRLKVDDGISHWWSGPDIAGDVWCLVCPTDGCSACLPRLMLPYLERTYHMTCISWQRVCLDLLRNSLSAYSKCRVSRIDRVTPNVQYATCILAWSASLICGVLLGKQARVQEWLDECF